MKARFIPFVAVFVFLSFLTLPAGAISITYTYDTAGRLIKTDYDNTRYISYAYDANGNVLTQAVVMTSDVRGDANGDAQLTLADVIMILKVSTGYPLSPNLKADVNSDGKIGLAEAEFVLQTLSGMRK